MKQTAQTSVPVKVFTQGVTRTIRRVTNLAGSGLVRVVTHDLNGTPIIKCLLCLYRTLKESRVPRNKNKTVQNDTLVSTCLIFETSLLWYEGIVDVQRNMQKARLTKLNYQQTDGTEKHKKDKTNTV